MSPKNLHIVSFTVPYPANYGGVIDVYYKLTALAEAGVHIHLHCFTYGKRTQQKILERYADKVSYYPRHSGISFWLSKTPYIVSTRSSSQLLKILSSDDNPILFEGVHTCLYLGEASLKDKPKFVRIHNIESEYYNTLRDQARNWINSIYYADASKMLYKYESIMENAKRLFTISDHDHNYYSNMFARVTMLPPFHGNDSVTAQPGKGSYVLYHGDLSIEGNQRMVEFILNDIHVPEKYRVVIAGRSPSTRLTAVISKSNNTELIANPSDEKMDELIRGAQINLLPAVGHTGFRLKLLNALYKGRHILTNAEMIEGTGLSDLCHLANTTDAFSQKLSELLNLEITSDEIDKRAQYLNKHFSNKANAELLIEQIWNK